MSTNPTVRAGATRSIVELIEKVWPGVRVNQLTIMMDDRAPGTIGYEIHGGVMSVLFSLSGDAETMLRHGVIDRTELDSLPATGGRTVGSWSIKRGARRVCVRCYICDPEPFHDKPQNANAQRLWDCLARVIAPALWTPPVRSP